MKKTTTVPVQGGTASKNARRLRRILAMLATDPALLERWIRSGERTVSRRRPKKS